MIDLKPILFHLNGKLRKDEARIGLFVAAVGKRTLELTATDHPQEFLLDSAALVGDWMAVGRRLNISSLWSDPFKPLRERTREFAAKWNLDPVFREAMG